MAAPRGKAAPKGRAAPGAEAPSTAPEEDALAVEAAMGALKLARHRYEHGRYEEAAKLFHEAYKLDPKTAFLYNAARAEQRAFQYVKAIADFDKLLARADLEPSLARKARTHRKESVELLERENAAKAALAGTGPAMVPKPDPAARPDPAAQPDPAALPDPVSPSTAVIPPAADLHKPAAPTPWGAYSALGGGLLLGAGAAVMWVMASGDRADLQDKLDTAKDGKVVGITRADALTRLDEISTRETVGVALAGVAAASVGVGVWLWLSGPGEAPKSNGDQAGRAVRLDLGPGRASLRVLF